MTSIESGKRTIDCVVNLSQGILKVMILSSCLSVIKKYNVIFDILTGSIGLSTQVYRVKSHYVYDNEWMTCKQMHYSYGLL